MLARKVAVGRFAERAAGERSEAAARAVAGGVPNPELLERPRRRRFSAAYKLRILEQAEACTEAGEVGALLRREGLYSSTLSKWRRQREAGALAALQRPRGRKPADPREAQIATLTRRAERAECELAKAHRVIEVQGNISALFGELLETEGATKPENSGR